MKKCLLGAVVLVFLLPEAGFGQAGQGTPAKIVTLSGKVSADAKFLAAAHHANLSIANPEMVASHAGQIVSVRCERDAATNTIRIVAVKSAHDEAVYKAHLDDAAFRR